MSGTASKATEARTLTQAELLAEATERFGADPAQWAFQCPSCGDAATGRDFRKALEAHPRKTAGGDRLTASHLLGQECIGRTLGALKRNAKYAGRGCDWCAFGLFAGPWTVVLPNGREMHCFPLASAAVMSGGES